MSVLRKRSPWVLPAAGLLVGTLALGLAGCGGGDNAPFPTTGGPITISNAPAPTPQKAQNPQTVVTGQGQTLLSGVITDLTQTNGVISAKVTFPTNSILQNATLAVEIVPTAQNTVVRLQQTNPSAVAGITPVVEIDLGPVGSDGKIDLSRPIVFGSSPQTTTITLSPTQSNTLQQQLQAPGNTLVVRTNSGGLLSPTTCTATLDPVAHTITLVGSCSGAIDVTIENTASHPQGGLT